jgi:hypothetical protein
MCLDLPECPAIQEIPAALTIVLPGAKGGIKGQACLLGGGQDHAGELMQRRDEPLMREPIPREMSWTDRWLL